MSFNALAIIALVTAATFASCRYIAARHWMSRRPWVSIAAGAACLIACCVFGCLAFMHLFSHEVGSAAHVSMAMSACNYGIMVSGVAGALVGLNEKRNRR